MTAFSFILLWLSALASVQAISVENCFHDGYNFTLLHPDAEDHIRCGTTFWYCEINYDSETSSEAFSFPKTFYTQGVSSGNGANIAQECQTITSGPYNSSVDWKTTFMSTLPLSSFAQNITSFYTGPFVGLERQLISFRHPQVCDGIGWASGLLTTQTGFVDVRIPTIFQSVSPASPFYSQWLCQCDTSLYYSVYEMKTVPNIAYPGTACVARQEASKI